MSMPTSLGMTLPMQDLPRLPLNNKASGFLRRVHPMRAHPKIVESKKTPLSIEMKMSWSGIPRRNLPLKLSLPSARLVGPLLGNQIIRTPFTRQMSMFGVKTRMNHGRGRTLSIGGRLLGPVQVTRAAVNGVAVNGTPGLTILLLWEVTLHGPICDPQSSPFR